MKIESTKRIGFMDFTDFNWEIENCKTSIYPSEEALLERKCIDECGIVEVEVRVIEVVRRPSESSLDNLE